MCGAWCLVPLRPRSPSSHQDSVLSIGREPLGRWCEPLPRGQRSRTLPRSSDALVASFALPFNRKAPFRGEPGTSGASKAAPLHILVLISMDQCNPGGKVPWASWGIRIFPQELARHGRPLTKLGRRSVLLKKKNKHATDTEADVRVVTRYNYASNPLVPPRGSQTAEKGPRQVQKPFRQRKVCIPTEPSVASQR